MAGNKLNTKTKGKEEKSKTSGKNIDHNSEETEDSDFALLRKPVYTSITGFGQARKIYDLATEELKTLLSNECDVLYECKVCRNIFRSLANFISHKRVYCKEKFNTTTHGHFIKSTTMLNELMKIKRSEETYQESLKENGLDITEIDESDERVPLSKDLTEVIEKIAKKQKLCNDNSDEKTVVTQKIPNSSAAVFQSVEPKEGQLDNIKIQVKELHQMLSRDTAVLQKDGKFKIQSTIPQESDNVIQISDDDDDGSDNELKCKICDMQFSTLKTLRFHMKYKHEESRLVYPCPDCLEIFSTSWSVYRHLFKVHRKTAAQIRRLRESIQAKAFKMNNPPAFYEKRKNNNTKIAAIKISEEERLDQENQAWMDNMEGDSEGPRCGGCGRSFERRAALAAHTHTCVPRTRALSAARPPRRQDHKRIQIQIRRDYNKEPVITAQPAPAISSLLARTALVNGNNANEEVALSPMTMSNSLQNNEETHELEMNPIEHVDVSEEEQTSGDVTDSFEKMDCTRLGEAPEPVIKLPFAQQAEKGNLAALKIKIQPDIDLDKLMCKKCGVICSNINELYDHTAEHYKWMRYACKLCNYKHYHFEKLPEHVKIVHKLKGDKDFHFSTVKAIDGPEALELAENVEMPDAGEISANSRRPSRCSSDSSRLSDDSSSSSVRIESGSRKRKAHPNKMYAKKRKEPSSKHAEDRNEDSIISDKDNDNDSTSNMKTFEENSSDIDDLDDKIIKQSSIDTASVASRRPIRKKVKPKNEDFEYDLSNLLKMEAQGYRDSQSTTISKPYQMKKKTQDIQINYESLNKYCCGALGSMSKKAVEKSAAHMKVNNFPNYSQKDRIPNVFVRPMVPKNLKGEKLSPKKDIGDKIELSSPNKESKEHKGRDKKDSPGLNKQEVEDRHLSVGPNKEQKGKDSNDSAIIYNESLLEDKQNTNKPNGEQNDENHSITLNKEQKDTKNNSSNPNKDKKVEENNANQSITEEPKYNDKKEIYNQNEQQKNERIFTSTISKDLKTKNVNEEYSNKTQNKEISTVKQDTNNGFDKDASESNKNLCQTLKPKVKVPAVVPLKFRRQSLEVVKNPMINKNIKDFAKTGMKTKILVIKPINRNPDGLKGSLSSPLKFQTIKLKDPTKNIKSEDKSSDQVVVVKVPKVECVVPRTTTEAITISQEVISNSSNVIDNNDALKVAVVAKTETTLCSVPTIDEDKGNEANCFHSECDSLQMDSESPAIDKNIIGVNKESVTDKCDNAKTAL